MNKILIELFVPMLDQRFQLFIPINKTIYQTTILIQKAIYEMTNGAYQINHNATLYNQKNGVMYNINELIKDSNLENGSQLILV